jgi:hypothetical protein
MEDFLEVQSSLAQRIVTAGLTQALTAEDAKDAEETKKEEKISKIKAGVVPK